MGPFGWSSANSLVSKADVVLAIGTKLGPSDTMSENVALLDPTRQTMIQIDVEPLNAGWTFPVDVALIGDAGFVMDRLGEASGSGSLRSQDALERVAAARQVRDADRHRLTTPDVDELPLDPQRTISLIEEAFADDGIITCDAGENRLFMMQWYRTKRNGEYLQPAAGGGMGYAVPAAMAAKLAAPPRSALAVCGDGGFAMSIHALMTAVQERLPIGVVVLNNGALGWVLHGMGDKAVAAHFAEFDHAEIARSLGCEGMRITSPDDAARRPQAPRRGHRSRRDRRSHVAGNLLQGCGPAAARVRAGKPPDQRAALSAASPHSGVSGAVGNGAPAASRAALSDAGGERRATGHRQR